MSTYMRGFHKTTKISFRTRRQFHVAVMRVMLNKAQPLIKNDKYYFTPANFQKFNVHMIKFFYPNVQHEDHTKFFTEILDNIEIQGSSISQTNSEHDQKSNSEALSEMEIEYSALQSDTTYSRNSSTLFLKTSCRTCPNIMNKLTLN